MSIRQHDKKKPVNRETCIDCGAPLEPDHAPNKQYCPACERLHVRYTRYKAHCRHGVHPRTPVSFEDWKAEHIEKYCSDCGLPLPPDVRGNTTYCPKCQELRSRYASYKTDCEHKSIEPVSFDAWKVGKRQFRREKEMQIQLPKTTLMPRTCIQCGRNFIGGGRALYCPDCRLERKRESAKESQQRRRAGKGIVIGETVGRCAVCGEKFIYASANQKYCSSCAPEAMAEHNRQMARGSFRRAVKKYGQEYADAFFAARRVDRAHCVDCGTPLAQEHGSNKIYCPTCAKIHSDYCNYKGYCKQKGREPLSFEVWKAERHKKHCVDCGVLLPSDCAWTQKYCAACKKLHDRYYFYKLNCRRRSREPVSFDDWKVGKR